MGNRAKYANYDGKITSLADVFGEGATSFGEERNERDKLYKALAYIRHCAANEPKHCTPATRNKMEAARLNAQRLCEEALLEDLIDTMRWADDYVPADLAKLPDNATSEQRLANYTRATEYANTCGTEVLWSSYRDFIKYVGGESVTFRSYVEAATRASLMEVWNEDEGDVLMPTKGNTQTLIGNLITYAQRMGFVVDSANDDDGSVAIVLVGIKKVYVKKAGEKKAREMKLAARSGRKITRIQ
jgi:hypothetical protein